MKLERVNRQVYVVTGLSDRKRTYLIKYSSLKKLTTKLINMYINTPKHQSRWSSRGLICTCDYGDYYTPPSYCNIDHRKKEDYIEKLTNRLYKLLLEKFNINNTLQLGNKIKLEIENKKVYLLTGNLNRKRTYLIKYSALRGLADEIIEIYSNKPKHAERWEKRGLLCDCYDGDTSFHYCDIDHIRYEEYLEKLSHRLYKLLLEKFNKIGVIK